MSTRFEIMMQQPELFLLSSLRNIQNLVRRRVLFIARKEKEMSGLFIRANVFINNGFESTVIGVSETDGIVISSGDIGLDHNDHENHKKIIECKNWFIFPGFTDVHVHLREPGFNYKEDIATGTVAGAHGGYTSLCSMPNLNPVPDSIENLETELSAIAESALISVFPYGAITKGEQGEELSDMEGMADSVIAFSDDGKGVQSQEIMLAAMHRAKKLGKIIAAHCEDRTLLNGGCIHDGRYAKIYGHPGICSESEWKQVERDIELVRRSGCAYHVCHVSTKESVELIRNAKTQGLDITCETAPHYLVLSDMDIQEDGRFKMNPPLRSEQDRLALIEGIMDGTIDMIATDHAPHSEAEKSGGLEKSLMGVAGLETAFPILYTKLVRTGIISLEKLTELMSINPANRFGIKPAVIGGNKADFTIYDLGAKYEINPEDFLSKGRSTPFAGETVYGKCMMTVCGGKIVWCDPAFDI